MISIILLLVLFVLTGLCFFLAWRWKRLRSLSLVAASGFLTFFLLELALSCYYRLSNGFWYPQWKPNPNKDLFNERFYTVVGNKPDVDATFGEVHIQHNHQGYRDVNFEAKQGQFRIAAIGGSTTYGVGVSNDETWPALLEREFHGDTAVFNLATPGHSTVENLITAALYLEALNPDVILLHVGLNDLRVSNIANLQPDYSNFHAPNMLGSMGQCYLEGLPRITTLYYGIRTMQKLGWYPRCAYHRRHYHLGKGRGLDEKALGYYKTNLKKLLDVCQTSSPYVFVLPQILIEEKVKNNALKWWIPGIKDDALISVMNAYNEVSREVTITRKDKFVGELLDQTWTASDFTDPSHLNAGGNKRFAEIVAGAIRQALHQSDSVTAVTTR